MTPVCGDLVHVNALSHCDILKAITSLKGSGSAGKDKIPPYLVKACAEHLIYPLLIIFNLSLRTATFSSAWKKTKIIPIPKKGDGRLLKNYRPIALISVFSKVFESAIHCRIFNQV